MGYAPPTALRAGLFGRLPGIGLAVFTLFIGLLAGLRHQCRQGCRTGAAMQCQGKPPSSRSWCAQRNSNRQPGKAANKSHYVYHHAHAHTNIVDWTNL